MKIKPSIQALTWSEVRKDVAKVNPTIVSIIDDLSPDDSFVLYRVIYPYGAMIFNNGTLQLPDQFGNLVSIGHSNLENRINENLSYSTMPMALLLKQSAELFFEMETRVIPITVFSPGSLIGAWETLDPRYSYFSKLGWSMTAGSRSIFMLPKISEAMGYQRLRRDFNVRSPMPKLLKHQWQLFKEIINSENSSTPWFSEILLFSHKWYELLQKQEAFFPLRHYCHQNGWYRSVFWRFELLLNIMWQQFTLGLKKKNVKYGSYQLETIKHLIAMGLGSMPSFKSAATDNSMAPIELLQNIFVHCYGLNYCPTLMCAQYFSMSEVGSFSYYSINESTLIESFFICREINNIMQTTREIKELFEHFRSEIMEGVLEIEKTPIHTLLSQVNFDFFHSDVDPSRLLQLSSGLPEEDASLIKTSGKTSALPFCESSTFLRGCVRLNVKPSPGIAK